jgi:peptide chain release factor 2
MLRLEDAKQRLTAFEPALNDLAEAIDYKAKKEEVLKLEEISMHEKFWDDIKRSNEVFAQLKSLKSQIEQYNVLKEKFDDAKTMMDIAFESQDESLTDEILLMAEEFFLEFEKVKLTTLLTGEYDSKNAILTFHAGAGGTEAQDWAQMLYRMYTRWAERRNFTYRILDYLDGDEAGLKSASILIEGNNAYGYLKSERGVHRLVRISPFDSSGRRHTSFASLDVIPEIDDDVHVTIKDEDLKIDTFRSGGAGGQHVNKTESAIRITHIPSGIVVSCQNERSQHQNREIAMKMLRSKLAEIKEREQYERIEDIKGVQRDIAWGSQIRSYVFMPYTMVKDHRTGYEVGNIGAVMDGELDGFINEYLKASGLGKIEQA